MSEPSEYLKVAEVASMFGVSTRTVVRWSESGDLPAAFRTVGGHRRFARETVEQFRRAHESYTADN